MKKILILASLLFCTQTIFAQLEKGMISVGLSSEISTQKKIDENVGSSSLYKSNRTTKESTYLLNPTVNYFISKRFSVGLSIGYIGSKSSTEFNSYNLPNNSGGVNYDETKSNGINLGSNITYYIPLNDNIYFFLRGGVGGSFRSEKTSGYNQTTTLDANGNVISINNTSEYGPNSSNSIYISTGIKPGVLFMPSKKIGLEFSLGNIINYSYSDYNVNNSNGYNDTTSSFSFLDFRTFSLGTSL